MWNPNSQDRWRSKTDHAGGPQRRAREPGVEERSARVDDPELERKRSDNEIPDSPSKTTASFASSSSSSSSPSSSAYAVDMSCDDPSTQKIKKGFKHSKTQYIYPQI